MLYNLKIKLTSKMLGDQRTRDNIRRFDRPAALQGDIRMDIPRWHWAIREAFSSLQLDEVDHRKILMEHRLKSPRVDLYVRKWTQENKRTGAKENCREMFENIREGAELTLQVLVTDELSPEELDVGLRAPTPEELTKVFSVIGELVGISPWGNNFGYGRFTVLSLTATQPGTK